MKKHYNESLSYPYTIANIKRQIADKRKALDSFKEESYAITLKEAATSDQLNDFIRMVFVDEIILLGLREAHARNLFKVVGQSDHNSFEQRYRSRDSGAQIIFELDNVAYDNSSLFKTTFGFNKLVDASLFSWERLADSPLSDTTDEVTFATSNMYRRENQLMWDNLVRYSQGANATTWGNYIVGEGVCAPDGTSDEDDADAVLDTMEEAYLSMTTAMTDRFDPSSLRWLLSPTVLSLLWKSPRFRRFDALGSTPNVISGRLPEPYGIPMTVIEPGYFRQAGGDSEYVSQECDIFLVAPAFAAGIRERVSLRLDGLTKEEIMASGSMIWERICCWTRHPKAFRRISPNQAYASQIADSKDILIQLKDEDE